MECFNYVITIHSPVYIPEENIKEQLEEYLNDENEEWVEGVVVTSVNQSSD